MSVRPFTRRRCVRFFGAQSGVRQFLWRSHTKVFTTMRMISPVRLLFIGGLVLAGCHTAEKVAVTSFRVIDAPAKYIRDRIDSSDSTTTTTTTTTTSDVSDVATPGTPVNNPPATATQRHVTSTHAPSSPRSTPPARPEAGTANHRKAVTSATPRPTTPQAAQFPTAKPVPGKPGYVYSVDPKGGIVDVTGYKPGDKAKDPYTQQIFIVP